ncbi:PilZ domain-containing protein [Thiomicrospira microaerophila]|uniref:PilZ domain-containing protein n=1 Tax=Thiomicrospira microaerophila TaxID=406020 RepID=UPI0005CA9613|nr:PilZ domain-containing protein [Thiomicrospira microaerophila]
MNHSLMGADKRRAKRANLDKQATMLIEQKQLSVRVVNISTIGLGIISPIQLEAQTYIAIRLELLLNNQQIPLHLAGHVVHTTAVQTQFLVGIELDKPSEYCQRIIHQYVTQHR